MSHKKATADTTPIPTTPERGSEEYKEMVKQANLKLSAATLIALEARPYVGDVLFAMNRHAVPGLGTFASDTRFNMYYDPAVCLAWDVEHVASVILHESDHMLSLHGERTKTLGQPRYAKIANIAGDAIINTNLKAEGLDLPINGVYIDTLVKQGLDVNVNMSMEQIYKMLVEKAEESCTCGQSSQSDSTDSDQGDQGEGDSPSDAPCTCDDNADQSGDQSSEGQGDGDDAQDDASEGQGGSESDNAQDDGSGDGSGEAQGEGSASATGGSGAGTDPNCPQHGEKPSGGSGEAQGEGSGDGSGAGQAPGTGQDGDADCPIHGLPTEGWDCGSGSDGIPRDYEVEGGINEERADVIRRGVARQVREHKKSRGTVPSSWERWADEILDPKVDWRTMLGSMVRREIAILQGVRDYTYSRPSRRQSSFRKRGSGIVLPAMRKPPPPNVSIVVDTSGSMSDTMLGWALSETQGVLKTLGSSGRNVSVVSCDAAAGTSQRVRQVSQVNLSGGGGTDMRVGINAALEQRPAADVIIVLSDGYTPWPDEPTKVPLIIGLTCGESETQTPDWARVVHISREDS